MKLSIPPCRCPFCHEPVTPDTARLACNACTAWHHQECWREGAMRCAACRSRETGFARPSHLREVRCLAPRPSARQASRRSRWRSAIFLGALLLLSLGAAGLVGAAGPDAPRTRWTDLALTVGIVSGTLGLCGLVLWSLFAPWQLLSDALLLRATSWRERRAPTPRETSSERPWQAPSDAPRTPRSARVRLAPP